MGRNTSAADATRRQFLKDCMSGLGGVALASLLDDAVLGSAAHAAGGPGLPRSHFPAKVKNVIFLHMAGAPSQIDLFDPKPKLRELHGQECPAELLDGTQFAFIRGTPRILGSPYEFSRHGKSGQEFSELLPHLGTVADKLTVVRSMQTDQFNHAPAQLFMHTGSQRPGRASMGSWANYGLGF